ncbi:Uma2 family endonuclease [Nocardia macrotermitis]|uniref:Putative restriction endonuclease domain-containing protein n=1 Tax=Nocardia macrotermitis TaxID=2585198 RepID=A0A7K0D3Q3_9NOCA|nr:Uma2 family endonuclease [Nocardia macrotermitis]MQY20348.1 hypothetical protein [Nocardia macrotermitis]
MSLHNELVEIAAAMDVPEGFRADAKGDVIVVSPQRSAHWHAIFDIAFRIRVKAPGLRIESDVKVAGTGKNDKAPDISIFHINSELHASKALTFVEIVSNSSRETDYIDKPGICAAAGVPEYLIVDPEREVWTLHTEPTSVGYQTVVTEPISAPVEIAGVRVDLG